MLESCHINGGFIHLEMFYNAHTGWLGGYSA